MLTGDALLTSLHVARHVHICNPAKPLATLRSDPEPIWALREDSSGEETLKQFSVEVCSMYAAPTSLV